MMSSLLKPLARAISRIGSLYAAVATVAVSLMVIHVALDVGARNLLGHGLDGTMDLVSLYYMVAIVCFPLCRIEVENEQIFVEILFQHLPQMLRRGLTAVSSLVSASFFALFAVVTWEGAVDAMARGERTMSVAETLIWPARFILPITFAVVAAAALLRAVLISAGTTSQGDLLGFEID